MQQVALEMRVSYSNVANSMQEVKGRLNATTLASCVMRAHALGLLSHPTGADHSVVPLPHMPR